MSSRNKGRCEGCGALQGQAHDRECPTQKTTVTDKRKVTTDGPVAPELTPEEIQAKEQAAQQLLAKQAAEENERPDTGAHTGEGPQKVSVVTGFVVLLQHDGTAMAGPIDLEYLANVELTRDVNASDMFKSCAEVQKDIQAGDTAQAVVNYMQQASAAMAANRMAGQQAQATIKRR